MASSLPASPPSKRVRGDVVEVKGSTMASDSERTAENPKPEVSTSDYRGVQYDRKNNRWRVRIHTDKTRHVGYFHDEIEAARAWDQAALRWSCDGETMNRLNFLEESFAKFKEFVEEAGPLDRFLSELKGVEKKETNTVPPMTVYVASINHNRAEEFIGEFFSARDAARAYDWKALERFGWGYLTNFPLANYEQECIHRGGLSGLDNHKMPPFPDLKRFAESKLILSNQQDRNRDNAVASVPPVTFVPATVDGVAGKAPMSAITAAHVGQIVQAEQPANSGLLTEIFGIGGMPLPLAVPTDAKVASAGVGIGGGSVGGVVDGGVAGAAAGGVVQALQTIPVPAAAVLTTTTSEVPQANPPPATPNYNNTDSNNPPFEPVATVSLGTFDEKSAAEDALARAELMIKGASRFTEEEYRKHVELVQRSQALLQDRIKESNGEFHVSLKILGKSFELGPYPTAHEARMAHDKYSMVLHGATARMFNTMTDVLLPREEAESLLSAMNKIRSGITPPPDPPVHMNGAASSGLTDAVATNTPAAAITLNAVAGIPKSSLVANAFTSTLRKVASQTSLVEDVADMNKQLERFESSIRAHLPKVGSLDARSPYAPRDGSTTNPPATDLTPFPLPTYPPTSAND